MMGQGAAPPGSIAGWALRTALPRDNAASDDNSTAGGLVPQAFLSQVKLP